MPKRFLVTSRLFWCGTGLMLALVAGCEQSDLLSSPTAARLRGLAVVYLDYAVAKGSGPANEQVLRKHMQNVLPVMLQANGMNTAAGEAPFVSERDGETFVIVYGLGVSQAKGTAAPVIAYEKRGRDGIRLAAFANGKVDCIEEGSAKDLLLGKL